MNKLCCTVVVLVLLAASSALASSSVNNIELTWQNGQTVARIDVEGTVRFSHQTEIAKDGKPFRVIVDILKARHELGAKKFLDLPACPVLSIRTSQFAVQPEEVVRVVFDMNKETAYQVASNQQSVVVTFPDKNGRQFAAWSSAAWLSAQPKKTEVKPAVAEKAAPSKPMAEAPSKAKSAAEVNAAIDKDRMASLGSTTEKPTTQKPAQAEPKVKVKPTEQPKAEKPTAAAAPPTEPAAPAPKFSEKDKWAGLYDETPAVKQTEPEKPEPKDPVVVSKDQPPSKAATQPKSSAPKQSEVTAKADPKPAASKPVAKADSKPAVQAKPKADPKPSSRASDKTAKVDRAKDATQGNVKPPEKKSKTMVKADKDSKKSDDKPADKSKSSTSRFRRSPTESKKIKGTMVAEFPKRLVVKYKARAYRDPFETLINETQVSNDPIEQRIPNVEGLRLVGILESEGAKNRALLEDASGYGYILQSGDRVKKGYVLRIESDKVYFQIFEYGWSRTIALHIED